MANNSTIDNTSNNTASVSPFIKWAGGKRSIAKEILNKVPKDFNNYYELFLGGGAVFYSLYNQGLLNNKQIFLNDLNSELIITYKVIKNNPQELIKKLEIHKEEHFKAWPWKKEGDKEVKDDNGYYYQLRAKELTNEIEIAARMIYLNRTGFNGLYRVNSKGKFNVPAGKYQNPEIVNKENITNVNIALKTTTLLNLDYHKITPQANDFVYLDPPYDIIKENSFTKYQAGDFNWDNQVDLFDYCQSLDNNKVKFLYSNHATDRIIELFKDYNITILEVNRPIASKVENRKAVQEVLISNY